MVEIIFSFLFKFSYFCARNSLYNYINHTLRARVRASSLYHQLQRGPGPLLVLLNNNNIQNELHRVGLDIYSWRAKENRRYNIFPIILFGSLPFYEARLLCCQRSVMCYVLLIQWGTISGWWRVQPRCT